MDFWRSFVLTFSYQCPSLLSSQSSATLHYTFVVHFGFSKSLIHSPCFGTALNLSISSFIFNTSICPYSVYRVHQNSERAVLRKFIRFCQWLKITLLQIWKYSYTLPLTDCGLEMIRVVQSLFSPCNKHVGNKKAKLQYRQFVIRKSYMWGFGLNHQ